MWGHPPLAVRPAELRSDAGTPACARLAAMKPLGTLPALLVGFSPVISLLLRFNCLRGSASRLKPREAGAATEFLVAPGMRILAADSLFPLAAFTTLVRVASRSAGGSIDAVLVPVSVLAAILSCNARSCERGSWRHPPKTLAEKETGNRLERYRLDAAGSEHRVSEVKSKNGGVRFSPPTTTKMIPQQASSPRSFP